LLQLGLVVMTDEDQLIEEAKKLPIPEQVCHKLWRVREAALRKVREAIANGSTAPSASDANLLAGAVRDANAAVQLAALDAVVALCDACADDATASAVLRKTGAAAAIARGIAEKCLAGRPQNRARALDAALGLVSCDAGDDLVTVLCDVGYENRLPKVVSAAADILRTCIREFGCGSNGEAAISANTASKGLDKLLDHSNQEVRSAGKALLLEIYSWLGQSFLERILKQVDIKPVMKAELTEACRNLAEHATHVPGQKRKPPRLTRRLERTQRVRSQQPREEGAGAPRASTKAIPERDPSLACRADADPGVCIGSLVDAVQVRVDAEDEGKSQQTLDFFQALGHQKWSVRKSALDNFLEKLQAASHIDTTRGSQLAAEIQRLIGKDANVAVATAAARVIAQLATKSDKNFRAYGKMLAIVALSRLKEKNRILVEALRAALDALAASRAVEFSEVTPAIIEAATAKVPGSRTIALQWCSRLIRQCSAQDLRPALRELKPMLAQTTADAAADVREAALECVALLQVQCGTNAVSSLIEGLEKSKLDKIQKIVADESKELRAKPASPAQQVSSAQPGRKPNAASYLSSSIIEDSFAVPPKRPGKMDAPVSAAAAGAAAAAAHYAHERIASTTGAGPERMLRKASDGQGIVLADAAAGSRRTPIAKDMLVAGNDEDHSSVHSGALLEQECKALEQLVEQAVESDDHGALGRCRALVQRIHTTIAQCPQRSLRTARVASLAETIAYLWIQAPGLTECSQLLLELASLGTPALVFACFERVCRDIPDLRARILALEFIQYQLVERFGMDSLPMGAVLDMTRPLLPEQPPACADVVLRVIASLVRSKYGTEMQRGLVELGIPAAYRAQLEHLDQENAAPSVVNCNGPMSGDVEKSGAGSEQNPLKSVRGSRYTNCTMSSMPTNCGSTAWSSPAERHSGTTRTLVLDRIQPVLRNLESANWKLRQEALQDLLRKLAEPDLVVDIRTISPELLKALASRIADTNRNLGVCALNVLTHLGEATVESMKTQRLPGADDSILRLFLGSVIQHGVNDNKRMVREAALQCMSAWYPAVERDNTDSRPSFARYIAAALSLELPAARLETLQWLCERWSRDAEQRTPSEAEARLVLEPVLLCFRDKNGHVRQLAERLVEVIVRLIGYAPIAAQIRDISNEQVRKDVLTRTEKFRSMSPARSNRSIVSSPQASPGGASAPQTPASDVSERRLHAEQADTLNAGDGSPLGAVPVSRDAFQLDADMQHSDTQFAAMLARAKADTAVVVGTGTAALDSQVPTGRRPVQPPIDGLSEPRALSAVPSLQLPPERAIRLDETANGHTGSEPPIAPTPCLPEGRFWRRTAVPAAGAGVTATAVAASGAAASGAAAAADSAEQQVRRLSHTLLGESASAEERIQAAKELSAMMKAGQERSLQHHAADLCLGLTQGIRSVLAAAAEASPVDAAGMRIVKYLLNALMHLIMKRELACLLSLAALELLITEVCDRLLDHRVPAYPEGPQLLRAYNLLMLKTLEHAPVLVLSRALVRALRAAVRSVQTVPVSQAPTSSKETTPSRIVMLQKCLHRLCNQVLTSGPNTEKTVTGATSPLLETHLDLLLYELHVLFTMCATLPADRVQQTCDEARLLVRALCHHCGIDTVRSHLRLVPVAVQPFLVRLVDALARQDTDWERIPLIAPATPLEALPSSGTAAPRSEASPPPPTSAPTLQTQQIRERLARLRAHRQRNA